jgi:hypothetical protein
MIKGPVPPVGVQKLLLHSVSKLLGGGISALLCAKYDPLSSIKRTASSALNGFNTKYGGSCAISPIHGADRSSVEYGGVGSSHDRLPSLWIRP